MTVIERNAQAQARLVEELLDLSRIESGQLRLHIEPVDAAGVVQSALEAVRPAAEARGVELVTAIDPSARWLSADGDRLRQVAWNLLSNAVKFTPSGGRVTLALVAGRRGAAAGGHRHGARHRAGVPVAGVRPLLAGRHARGARRARPRHRPGDRARAGGGARRDAWKCPVPAKGRARRSRSRCPAGWSSPADSRRCADRPTARSGSGWVRPQLELRATTRLVWRCAARQPAGSERAAAWPSDGAISCDARTTASEVDAGLDAQAVQHVEQVFGRQVARRTGREGAAAQVHRPTHQTS